MAIILSDSKDHPLTAEIMVVDDQPTSRVILETILRSIGDNVHVFGYGDPLTALQALGSGRLPDLIVADYRMPGLDGIAFTRGIRQTPSCHDIPLVIVTVMEERSVMYGALEAGATDFLTKPVDHYECKVRCRNLLTLRRQQLIIRNRAHALEARVHQAQEEMRARERDMLERLALAGGYRENVNLRQLQHIGRFARVMAQRLGYPGQFCETIELAATLQDIGRIGVPDAVLRPDGMLTAEETRSMQNHTHIGYELLKDSLSPILQMGATIALHHHEAFDGSGYPAGLAGAAIPVEARIVAAANAFATMDGARLCNPPRPHPETLAEMTRFRGVQLDPDCVDILHACADDLTSGDSGSMAHGP
jgi:two-component system response regulator RpfG